MCLFSNVNFDGTELFVVFRHNDATLLHQPGSHMRSKETKAMSAILWDPSMPPPTSPTSEADPAAPGSSLPPLSSFDPFA